jgi:DNA-binding NarL/FixJ family response regulator
MNIKVAIADDHHLIAEGIQNMLRYSGEMEVVGSYSDGASLLKGLSSICPDVLRTAGYFLRMRGTSLSPVLLSRPGIQCPYKSSLQKRNTIQSVGWLSLISTGI